MWKLFRRWRYQLLAMLSATLVVIAGCASDLDAPTPTATPQGADPAAEGVVNLYSSRHYDTDRALYDNFTEQTGIKVNLIEAEGDELIERIKSEGENSPADVFLTVDVGRLWRAQEEGILKPIESAVLSEKVPENLRQKEGYWFGFSSRARVIVFNKDKVKPEELSTYENLADPKWSGRVVVRSSSNIYNQSLVGAMIAADGVEKTEAWVKGLVANFARPPEGNDTAQIRAVADGVADLAIANGYYLARLANSTDEAERQIAEKVEMFFPNQGDRGTHINISGGGIVTTAPHAENGIKFLEYLVSPEAQTIFAKGNNEYPVVKDAPLDNAYLEKHADFKADTLDLETIGKNNAEALKLMDRAGWR